MYIGLDRRSFKSTYDFNVVTMTIGFSGSLDFDRQFSDECEYTDISCLFIEFFFSMRTACIITCLIFTACDDQWLVPVAFLAYAVYESSFSLVIYCLAQYFMIVYREGLYSVCFFPGVLKSYVQHTYNHHHSEVVCFYVWVDLIVNSRLLRNGMQAEFALLLLLCYHWCVYRQRVLLFTQFPL